MSTSAQALKQGRVMAGKNEDKVLAAALTVFMRHGFKKVTMGDLADAAQMSRTALYLVYPSKIDIFAALTAQVLAQLVQTVRDAVAHSDSPEEKLRAAFDLWCVQQFEKTLASPDTKDLLESSYIYAPEVTNQAFDDFVEIVAAVLQPLVARQKKLDMSAQQIAKMMASATPGFKATASSAEQLRSLVDGLLAVTLASIRSGR